MPAPCTVGEYILQRLEEAGVGHVFGIPGDYILDFYEQLVASPVRHVGTCTEIGAGFAADAYARVNGLGALCVTYCVGGLNALNAVAGAYAEKAPVIAISGAPGLDERKRSPLLHHIVKDFNTQRLIFEKVTAAAVALEDPAAAPELIDHVFDICMSHKRPVYIELPRDMARKRCAPPGTLRRERLKSDPKALEEALNETLGILRKARRPVILGGVEIHRFGLQDALLRLVEKTGFPLASTLLGKSIVEEDHPYFLGIYEGAMGLENVRRAVESSDCVLILGAFMTDINLGIFTANLDVAKTIYASSERTSVRFHHYENILLGDFIKGLAAAWKGAPKRPPARRRAERRPFRPQPGRKLTVGRFFARMEEFITKGFMVICDIGDSLFAAADLTIRGRTEFLSPAYYTSMGYAVPAALGAQMRGKQRPLVFVGDGAFQMTGQELSTIAKYGLNPIVFVLNNEGYTTERFIKEGPFNDIHNWAYHHLPAVLEAGWGREVRTEGELEDALRVAEANSTSFSLINVRLAKLDRSKALERLGKRLARARR